MKVNSTQLFRVALAVLAVSSQIFHLETDQILYDALRQAVSLENHSSWPNVDKSSLLDLPVSKTLRLAKTLYGHWQKIANSSAGSILPAAEQCAIRKDHRTVIMWLRAHQPSLHHLIRNIKIHLTDRLGLLLHYQQWPIELNRGLRSQPVHRCGGHSGCPNNLQKTTWDFLENAIVRLEKHIPKISEECRQLLAAGEAYEEGEGLQLTGSWRAIDVVKLLDLHSGLQDNRQHVCEVQEKAPTTCAAIAEFAAALRGNSDQSAVWLQEARFHLMLPGTHVMEHTAIHNQRLKIHCGLRNPGKVQLRIANYSLAWMEGRCIVIDDSFEHHVKVKRKQQARAILQLKISHPDLATVPLLKMGEVVRQPIMQNTPTEL